MRDSRLLRFAAIGTWAVCGLPVLAAIVAGRTSSVLAASWGAMFLVYGAALVTALGYRESARSTAVALIAVQSAAAAAMTALSSRYVDPTGIGLLTGVGLLVIVAAQLPHVLRARTAWWWIGAQTLIMTAVVAPPLAAADVATFGLGSAGFQAFACMTTSLMLREALARAELARVNAELHATRARLAEHSRARERLRIARELHDSIGHHLTALSLQLDVASRLADGSSGAGHVMQAHAITRLLLAEVRSVVGEMRDGVVVDFAQAMQTLAASVDTPAVHLDIPEPGVFVDDAQAHTLLRCVQEIITNASRHAHARNLWIRIRRGPSGIELTARDDGRGAADLQCGHGLTGMRERFAEHAGRVEFASGSGGGFEIHGVMPDAGRTP